MEVNWRLKELWSRIRDFQDLEDSSPAIQLQLKTACVNLLRVFDDESSVTVVRDLLTEAVLVAEAMLILADEKLSSFAYSEVPTIWRQLYTDATLIKVSAIFSSYSKSFEIFSSIDWCGLIKLLDMALIVSGVPGRGRRETTLFLIKIIQIQHIGKEDSIDDETVERPVKKFKPSLENHGSTPVKSSQSPPIGSRIPTLNPEPTDESFTAELHKKPFVIKSYCRDWPALKERRWKDFSYLKSSTGPGRFVPVEVGKSYSDEGWSQKIMSWYEFLSKLELRSDIVTEVNYLAQYDVFNQFPSLKKDIILPSYLYCRVPPESRPTPGTEDGVVLNAWLGPAGTISPAHTDPYYNCYAQIVGRKYVWVAPPWFSHEMYPFGETSDDKETLQSNFMTNTSQVDVLEDDITKLESKFPKFVKEVVPESMQIVLEEGDMLVMPPGWWHSMKSLETSINISMWF